MHNSHLHKHTYSACESTQSEIWCFECACFTFHPYLYIILQPCFHPSKSTPPSPWLFLYSSLQCVHTLQIKIHLSECWQCVRDWNQYPDLSLVVRYMVIRNQHTLSLTAGRAITGTYFLKGNTLVSSEMEQRRVWLCLLRLQRVQTGLDVGLQVRGGGWERG